MRRRNPLTVRMNRLSNRKPVTSRKRLPPLLITVLVGILVAFWAIHSIEVKLRPTVAALASTQVQNQVTAWLEQAVAEALEQQNLQYSDLITIQRDESGGIAALLSNTAALNRLRAALLDEILRDLSASDALRIQIPIGSLLDSDLTWGMGPKLSFSASFSGTVSAEFKSDFYASGFNQTLHRINLTLTVPVTVFLSGERREISAQTSIPIAETVIVGRIPAAYYHLPASG